MYQFEDDTQAQVILKGGPSTLLSNSWALEQFCLPVLYTSQVCPLWSPRLAGCFLEGPGKQQGGSKTREGAEQPRLIHNSCPFQWSPGAEAPGLWGCGRGEEVYLPAREIPEHLDCFYSEGPKVSTQEPDTRGCKNRGPSVLTSQGKSREQTGNARPQPLPFCPGQEEALPTIIPTTPSPVSNLFLKRASMNFYQRKQASDVSYTSVNAGCSCS